MLQARDFVEATGTDHLPPTAAIDLRKEFEDVGIGDVLAQLDHELIGLKPVKTRICEIASLLLIERVRKQIELTSEIPTLHMRRSPAIRGPERPRWRFDRQHPSQARLLVRRGQVVSVTRDELVGQYIGHTAPKTKEVLKKAMGGVLFIDEAH